ncbi:MAG: GDSL-type esterase/lipase family protein [Planctomycetota bacterium]|nr:GDSL-type esterase/lipase family protein [Planctomycetota bacterium]
MTSNMLCGRIVSQERRIAALAALVLCAAAHYASAAEPLLKRGQSRVVLVGDSITGLSRNYATGFAHQMDWALKQTYPGCRPDLVALGGSGQGVRSWRDVELRSRTQEVLLDVPGINVKSALSQPAEVLIIMLGMNDVLAPYVVDEAAAWEDWTTNYRELIAALRERLRPTVIALAGATLCTEDLASPKNHMLDKLNAQAAVLAKELNLLWLPTSEKMRDVLQQGRRLQPDFHVTYDYVHPNEPGHIAIAIAMLRGLGEEAAAKTVADQRLPQALEKAAGLPPRVSFQVTPVPTTLIEERQSFRVHYWLTVPQGSSSPPPRVTLAGDPWDVTPAVIENPEGEFLVSGIPNRRENVWQLIAVVDGQSVRRDVRIAPPWLVAAGSVAPFWNGQTLDTAKARGPVDEAIAAGRNFTVETDAGGLKPQWLRLFPSVNYTGGDAPGSVDFSAVTHARNFEAGYGARWIRSDHERTVNLTLSTQAFAGTQHLTVYLNGRDVYSGLLTGEPKRSKTLEVRLERGWNALAFRSNHVTWQWQCSVDVTKVGEDSLDDLRYSIVPKVPGP